MELTVMISGFLNKKLRLICLAFIILSVFVLVGCADQNTINTNPILDETQSECTTVNEKLLLEEDNYKIVRAGFEFEYFLYDRNGNIIENKTSYTEPKIDMISPTLGKLVISAGTGHGSIGTKYFDIDTGYISPCFYYVVAQKADLVAYFNGDSLIVQNIFNEQTYSESISLSNELSKIESPITKAEFSNDLKTITISYFSGSDPISISETVELNK